MRDKNKKILIVIVVAVIAILITIFVIKGINKKEQPKTNTIKQEEFTIESANGDKINTSETLKKDRQELGYSISNITLERKEAQTVFKLQISNQTNTIKKGQLVDIVFLGKNGEEIAKIGLYIREIKAGQSINTQAMVNNDFTNVYNFKIVVRQAD